jgi:hypothetical protein
MHSVRPSRSRIVFEVFCALVVAASCAGAWLQAGISALLPAAAVSALFAFVRALDLTRRQSVDASITQPVQLATTRQSDPLIVDDAGGALADDRSTPIIASAIDEAENSAPAATPAKAGRRSKSPQKGSARRAKVEKKAEIREPETDAATADLEAAEASPAIPPPQPAHPQIETLFEPEPYVRMLRPAFGRKAG